MIYKMKYGLPEILASFLGAVLMLAVEWLEKYMIYCGTIPLEAYNWFQLRVVILTIVSAIFGPVAALICASGGDLLISVVIQHNIDYIEMLSLVMYGYILGRFYEKFRVQTGEFRIREYVDFAAVAVMASVISGVMFMPLVSFVFVRTNLVLAITVGVKSVVGNGILNLVICGLVMFLTSSYIVRLKRGEIRHNYE